MDKNLAKIIYRLQGLPIAAWEMASKEHIADSTPLLAKLTLPVVVKPIRQGSSLGMSIVREAEQLAPALLPPLSTTTRSWWKSLSKAEKSPWA